jgi:CRP/FNR family transcriptional regulator, cyclic AMP receptor protein
MDSKRNTLARIPMFHGLDRAAIEALDGKCKWRAVAAHEWVIDYQEPGLDVYFVTTGTVRVLIHSHGGREVILADLDAGGVFGELAPIDGHPRSASVLAVNDTVIAVMPGPVFLYVLRNHPDVSMYVMKMLAAHVRAMDNRVVEYSTLDARHRVCCELLRLARPDPGRPRQGILSPAPTQNEIAARVSTNREIVSRTMGDLAREGFLRRTRGVITLTDIPALMRLIEQAGS